MTDELIIKNVRNSVYKNKPMLFGQKFLESVLDLINRQKAEIEELRSDKIVAERHEKDARDLFVDCTRQLEEAKTELKQLQTVLDEYPVKTLFGKNNLICSKTSEDYDKLIMDISNNAIKEFARELKCGVPQETGVIRCKDIDDLVKQMTEVKENVCIK